MKKNKISTILLFIFLVLSIQVFGCAPSNDLPLHPILPTDDFSHSDEFGDGFIANVAKSEVENLTPEEVIMLLVSQWLEHYKTQSGDPQATIKDYSIDEMVIFETPNSLYLYGAKVRFSVVPVEVPNAYAAFPGDPIDPNDPWWHIGAPFGVLEVDGRYYLRMLFGWGT